MKTKTMKMLPKINGTVHTQYVRCGKENCKCSRGELHGAYYYHFIRVDGKLRKRYLKHSEVDEVREACLLRQASAKAESKTYQRTWLAFRDVREQVRDIRNQIQIGD